MPEINYFWDEIEDNVVREYDENNNTIASYTTEPTRYGSVLSQERGGEKRYFQFDGLGNTMELTDESGSVTDTRRYTAFGEVADTSGASAVRHTFAGQFGYLASPQTSGFAVRARFVDPTIGRWKSADPLPYFPSVLDRRVYLVAPRAFSSSIVGSKSGFVKASSDQAIADRLQNCSTYIYVMQSPPNAIDPSGLLSLSTSPPLTFPPFPLSGAPKPPAVQVKPDPKNCLHNVVDFIVYDFIQPGIGWVPIFALNTRAQGRVGGVCTESFAYRVFIDLFETIFPGQMGPGLPAIAVVDEDAFLATPVPVIVRGACEVVAAQLMSPPPGPGISRYWRWQVDCYGDCKCEECQAAEAWILVRPPGYPPVQIRQDFHPVTDQDPAEAKCTIGSCEVPTTIVQ